MISFLKLSRNAGVGALVLTLSFPAGAAFANDPAPVSPAPPAVEEVDPAIPVGDESNDPAAGEKVSRQVRIAVETAHAFGSPESRDLMGFDESLYQGRWFMPNREDLRRCLSKIESHHNYRAGGYYRGAYQFSPALARGVTWMMQPEVRKEMGDAGVDLVQDLRKTPMNEWNRYWQDRAFWTIWNEGRGKSHWRAGQGRCF